MIRDPQHYSELGHHIEKHMTYTDLCNLLDATDMRALQDVRYVPTSFDSAAERISAFPHIIKPWTSGAAVFAAFSTRSLMTRLPLAWQMQISIHQACRENSAVMFSNTLNNSALGIEAVRSVDVDTIVSGRKAADLFSHELEDCRLLNRVAWLIIMSPDEDWSAPSLIEQKSRGVAREVHLFPGITLLTQCKYLTKEASDQFHISSDFEWIHAPASSFISGGTPMTLDKYKLPFALNVSGTCICGEVMYGRAA